ncbi:type VI secretion system baseplate subunit TssK [Desulfococcaceae bacterium HSG7]|nr:type VI secretion system baseplate subunit TssK [Desulfococcaceae bacterium HSG7]
MKERQEVLWSEGMFMLPHHFQFASRNLDLKLRQGTNHLSPFNWGFKHLEIDTEALKNYRFVIRSCEVIFGNGAQLTMPGNLVVHPRSFKHAGSGNDDLLDIYLCIPVWRPNAPNTISTDKSDEDESLLRRRFQSENIEIMDENSGANPRSIQVKRLQGKLFWEEEDRSGYNSIQIARVKLTSSGDVEGLDSDYIPPVVSIDSWPPLLGVCEDIANGLTIANGALVRDFTNREFTELLEMPRGLEAIIKMLATNGFVASLNQICKTPYLPPYTIYLELLRLASTLTLFKGKRSTASLPDYVHDDLGFCFFKLADIINRMMDRIGSSTFMQRPFQHRNERLEVEIEEDWASGARLIYIGVEGEENLSRLDQNVIRLKLCAPQDASVILQKRLGGIGMNRLRRVPAALPDKIGTYYFQVSMESTYWENIEKERIMSLIGDAHPNYSFTLYVV